MIDQIAEWKQKRNGMIHALMNKQLTDQSVEEVALEGCQLARNLCNKAGNYKRAVERKEAIK